MRPQPPGAILHSRSCLSSFLIERLQLGNALEVLGTTRCSFQMEKHLEIDEPYLEAEDRPQLGARQQRVVRSAARRLAHHVEVTGCRDEREVQTSLDGLAIETERQPRRRTT